MKTEFDPGLETLLDMDGYILDQTGGYWVKLEACRVSPTEGIPHGIRYSLTLHDRYGRRIMGYDNSHAVKPPKKFKYARQRMPYDHRHRHAADKGIPYEFRSAAQLLEDFFAEVDKVLKKVVK